MDYCKSVKLLLCLTVQVLMWKTVTVSPMDAEIASSLQSPRTGYACEGSTLTIQCAEDMRIRILRANYGRFSKAVCNDGRDMDGWDVQCMSTRSLRIVSDMCELRATRCDVIATNRLFGDPCALTPKYLEVQFRCETVPPVLSSTSSFDPVYPVELSRTSTDVGTQVRSTPTSTLAGSRPTAAGVVQTASASTSLSPLAVVTQAAFCEARLLRNVEWPRTPPGRTVIMDCPNNKNIRGATWHCSSYPVTWAGRPDLSQCVSDAVLDIHGMLQDSSEQYTTEKLEAAADELSSIPMTVDEVTFGGDIAAITSAMKEAVSQVEEHVHDVVPQSGLGLAHAVNDAVLRTGSFLLNDSQSESWMDLPQATQSETATRLLSTVEDSAYQVARTCNTPKTIVNVTLNIVVEVNVVDTSGDKKVDDVTFPKLDPARQSSWSGGGNSIRLTGDTIKQLGADGLAKIIFATYSNLEQYLHPQNDATDAASDLQYTRRPATQQQYPTTDTTHVQWQSDNRIYYVKDDEENRMQENEQKVVGTNIISASVGGRKAERVPLKEPVIYTLEHKSDINVFNPTCSFWEYSEKTMSGQWSTFGCKLVDTNVTHTTCACQHLTNFAVLMTVVPTVMSNVHEFTLSLITYFGCILSIVCLAAAFVTFFAFKNLQGDRNTIHKNLVASLLVAEVVFLVGIIQYHEPMLCSVIAGILHFVFLVAFVWMCLEGIQLYVMLVEVFEVERSRIRWYYAAGYGIPAVIVAISAGIYPAGYGTNNHCWLSTERGFIWAFVGPVCAIISVNIVMLSIAMYVMSRHASSAASSWKMKEKGKLENIRTYIKGAVVLIVLLGPTWAFGLFYINTQSIIMAYLFTVLNSLQGVFIFIFHCLMNEKTVKEYKRWIRRTSWLPSNVRMRCGGNKTTPSTTRNNSTTSGVNRIMTDQRLSLEYLTRLLSNRRRKRSSTSSIPTSTNTMKRSGGYNKIQRNSSGRDSGHLTDSGIACCNDDSHIYSEAATEDPAAYLDPVRIRLDPDEEVYWPGGSMSMMEGSVADTDYLDNFGRRGPGSANPASVNAINVDKYKIRPPPPSFPPPLLPTPTSSQDAPMKERESCQKLDPPPSPEPEPSVLLENDMYSSDESLVRRKLLALGEGEVPSSLQSSASTLMNNLNKCSSDASLSRDGAGLSAPNIVPTPPLPAAQPLGLVNRAITSSLQHSLPTLSSQASAGHHPGSKTHPKLSLIYSSVDARLNSISRSSQLPIGKHQPMI